jgi:hypothetical protein
MQTTKILSSFIAFLFLMIGCDLTEPFSLPSWDTNWKIFFRNDEVTLKEMIEDGSLKDSLSAQYGDTLIFISISDTTNKQFIDDEEMTFEPEGDVVSEAVGEIEIADPEPQTTAPATLEEFLGIPINEGNTIGPIPAGDIEYNPNTNFLTFDNYQRAVLDEGRMFLTFHNNLTLDINSGMMVSLFDSATNALVHTFTFNQAIERGQTVSSDTLFLNGTEIYNSFYLNYVVPISGIDSVHTVTVEDVSSNFTSDLVIEDMVVSEADAKIPEQVIDRSDASVLDTEDKYLIRAVIDSGFIEINVENMLEIDAEVRIEILSLVDENDGNAPMVIDTLLLRESTTFIRKSIGGRTILNHQNPGSVVDSIHYLVEGNTIATEDFRHVESTQEIIISVELGQVKTSEFEGEITTLSIDIDPVEVSDLLDLENFSGTFRMPDLELIFDFYNQIGFDVLVDLVITGIKEENGIPVDSVKILFNDFMINRATDQNPTEMTTLILNATSTTPSIVDLMEILPTTIKVEGAGVIENQTGKVSVGSAVWAEYRIESPLRINITEDLIYTANVEEMDLEDDTRKDLSENFDDVLLKFNPSNGIPLNLEMMFVLAIDSANLFSDLIADSSEKIILHNTVPAGNVNADGLVISPGISNDFELKMTKEQLQIFSKRDNDGNYLPVYNGMQIKINSNNQPVIFRNSDALNYDGYLDLKYRVNSDDK